MLRRLINDAVDVTARTSVLKALGNHLHYTLAPLEVDDIHDGVANAVRNVGLNVYAKVDLIIGTKI